ncbi:hypothetical protein, partial [Micromonospora sp. GCM10011541]|uniref:hypothetical protein n=1 Tax=Micromonospora sp. GCM10011541 TaxID=3317336 RepID=UPI003617AF47
TPPPAPETSATTSAPRSTSHISNTGTYRILVEITSVLGKIRTPKPARAPLDPVALAASDLRRRLTRQERQALIRELHEDA